MADLTEIQASQSIKIIGSTPDGDEQVGVSAVTDEEGFGRLLVAAQLSSGELVPTITSKFRIRNAITGVNLSNSVYTTLYERNGEGLFFGFQAAFNGSNVLVRLEIDNEIVFDLSIDTIRNFQFNDTSSTRMQLGGWLSTSGNVLDFSSKFAIPYDVNVRISAKRDGGGTVKSENWILFHTEDA